MLTRSELQREVVDWLISRRASVCLGDSVFDDTTRKLLLSSNTPSAWALLSFPPLIAVFPNKDTLWIYPQVAKRKQIRLPLETILYLLALDIYPVQAMHIVACGDGSMPGLWMDDVLRCARRVIIPRACADYWENEREYHAVALLPTDLPIVYDDDVRGAWLELDRQLVLQCVDWRLQLDVCFVGVGDDHI